MKPGEAMAACQTNSAEARDLALEASPLYVPLAELAREGFTGTVAELHARLDSMVSDAMRRSVRWPKAPNGLGNALRRMVTNLRAAGVELQFSRNDVQGRRVVSVLSENPGARNEPAAVPCRRRRRRRALCFVAPASARPSTAAGGSRSTDRPEKRNRAWLRIGLATPILAQNPHRPDHGHSTADVHRGKRDAAGPT